MAPAKCPVCQRTVGTSPSFWNRAATPGIHGRRIRKLARHHSGDGSWCRGGGIETEGDSGGQT